MKLLECYIRSFGKLQDVSYRFDEGLNSFYAENGSGKTTLTMFIASMFYGLNTDRKQSLDDNPRKKYMPWQGGVFGGTLTFLEDGVAYRIERTFGEKPTGDTVRIIEVATGAEARGYTPENIGYELFDINMDGFIRTVFISEKNIPDIASPTIAAKLSKIIGTDGDVGNIDAAKRLLEKKKGFYKKTGNRGEIPALLAEIRECDTRLLTVSRAEAEMEAIDKDIRALDTEISEIEAKSRALNEKYRLNIGRDAHSKLVSEYRTRLLALERDKRELASHAEFFAQGVPTEEEIDEARDAWGEAEKLRRERADRGSDEYAELSRFFERPTDFAELESMRAHFSKVTALNEEKRAVNLNMDFMEETMAESYPAHFPTTPKLEAYISSYSWSLKYFLLTSFLLIIAASVVLGIVLNPAYFLGLIALFPLVPTVNHIIRQRIATLKFMRENNIPTDHARRRLIAMREDAKKHEAAVAAHKERIHSISEELTEHEPPLMNFLSHYPTGSLAPGEALELVRRKYEKFYSLELTARENEAKRQENDVRITHLERISGEFLKRYPTEDTEDPFREIRARLGAYKYTMRSVRQKSDECEAFRLMHSIGEDECAVEVGGEMKAIEAELAGFDERIVALRAERVRRESEYERAYRTASLRDEVTAVRDGYAAKLAEYQEDYEVVVKTLELLEEASGAITSRYIGGTKERFERYLKIIAGDADGYSISTDFVIKKYDTGATRDAECYSRGTRDLHTLCLKIALCDAMYDSKVPLLILDDPFTTLDDDKLDGAKRLIRELARERQVLYFTCSKERAI